MLKKLAPALFLTLTLMSANIALADDVKKPGPMANPPCESKTDSQSGGGDNTGTSTGTDTKAAPATDVKTPPSQ